MCISGPGSLPFRSFPFGKAAGKNVWKKSFETFTLNLSPEKQKGGGSEGKSPSSESFSETGEKNRK